MAEEIDLTVERVRTVVESRLRAARMYTASDTVFGLVQIGISTLNENPAFVSHVSFLKWLEDPRGPRDGEAHLVSTWEQIHFGTYANDAGFVMQGVSELIDEFILDYLSANEAWC